MGGNFDRILRRTEEVVCREVAGETFLVPVMGKLADMQGIFSLNKIARDIWLRLDGKTPLSVIRDEVLGEYDVEECRAESDIAEFVEGLVNEGLAVEVG